MKWLKMKWLNKPKPDPLVLGTYAKLFDNLRQGLDFFKKPSSDEFTYKPVQYVKTSYGWVFIYQKTKENK